MSTLHPSGRIVGAMICSLLFFHGRLEADEVGAGGSAAGQSERESVIPPPAEVSSLADLERFAQHLATEDYVPEPPLEPALAELSYEQYRDIQFRNGRALWSDGEHPFWLEFFHRGFVQRDRVDVGVIERSVEGNHALTRRIPYDRELFDFSGAAAEVNITQPIGFAGFKVVGRFENGGFGQEMLTFIGSSYFRARTGQTVYGTSARGLAVNVGMDQDEEFPDFRAFWVYEPAPGDQQIRILALLDSPSVAGAYCFDFDPSTTVSKMRVQAKLYFRKVPDKLALAPLTSMWMWGDGLAPPPLDKRPSCHDSDGLLVHADGIWTWRAFARLPYPSVTAHAVDKLSGFGLLQRDRNFDHYGDTGARYDERPSVWVRPIKGFGAGRIEVMEIPGAHEGIDNIGAYFVADSAIDIQQPMQLKYDVLFFGDTRALTEYVEPKSEDGRRLASCESFDVGRDNGEMTLKIRFEGSAKWRTDDEQSERYLSARSGTSEWMVASVDELVPEIKTVRGEVGDVTVFTNGSDYLVTLKLKPTEESPVQLSLSLRTSDQERLTETFEYLCPHEKPRFVFPAVYTRQE